MRVGFICDDRLPSFWRAIRGQCGARELLTGCRSETAVGTMRVGWLIECVNGCRELNARYQWYRPFQAYDAVVYVKSMSEECCEHAASVRRNGGVAVFDANVDYFSGADSDVFYYEGMAPTDSQRKQAIAMARTCDGVIADSPHVLSVAESYSSRVVWIPDNVRDGLIVDADRLSPAKSAKINVFWSGQSAKLFELLLIGDALLSVKDRIKMIIITNGLDALQKWPLSQKKALEKLLGGLECERLPFTSIEDLCRAYDRGGVCIAPRHMDSSYNLGHTEWKITLAMARGVPALASPLESYRKVAERSEGRGIRICACEEDWRKALAAAAAGEYEREGGAAVNVVREYYSTSVVASDHVAFLNSIGAA